MNLKMTSRTLSPVLFLAFAVSAAADPIELPARKPGYWEILMTHKENAPVMTLHACIDAATDKVMMDAGMDAMQSMCSEREIKRDGDAYVWDTTCTMDSMKTTSHVVITGDFQSAYQMTISGEISGLGAPHKIVTTQKAKWLSDACPAGVKAGDLQMPGGLTVNTGEMIDALGVAKTPWRP
ncbi:Protein of unknown function [Hyphomicrobium facile]|uniref:DUF3617 family protein n=2 Tax=Hyphomicrobium facile TaxID=51670 RepID=A0A1I7MZ26_9HYPH|nr:Protein of unknown function [Hyphomicrobium facile]